MNNKFFTHIRIDHYTGPDITDYADLVMHYGTGQAYKIPHPYKKLTGYRRGIQTNLGDIEISEWQRLIKGLIKKKGEQDLFDKLLTWEKENHVLTKYDNITQHTLELFASRIFDNEEWYDFIPFNKKYFPEKLFTVSIVEVTTDCCQASLQMTMKQIEKIFNGRLHCPACQQYTTFTYNRKENCT